MLPAAVVEMSRACGHAIAAMLAHTLVYSSPTGPGHCVPSPVPLLLGVAAAGEPCRGSLSPRCEVAVPGLDQAVKAVAEQAGGEQRQQPRTVL
jgi:hypothetical protein